MNELEKVQTENLQNVEETSDEKIEKKPLLKRIFQNESFKIVYVLVLLAFISASLLGVVNHYTQIDENQQTLDMIRAVYASPIEKTLDIEGYEQMYGTEVKKYFVAKDGASIIQTKALKGNRICYSPEGITLIVIIKDDYIVEVYAVSHSETPGLGEKALKPSYLSQYKGVNQSLFIITEGTQIASTEDDGFSPIGVSGATYSTNGVNLAVKAAIKSYRHYLPSLYSDIEDS